MTGERFGPYLLDDMIGRGGMGEVWRARDQRKNGRVVALKRLPAEFAADASFRARFRREAEIAAGLQDLHVIPIHDYGEIDGRLFLDMALIDGVDLATLLGRGPLRPERAVDVVSQVAGAPDAAHAAGLLHRDVKPSNILLRDDRGADFAYLIDFGIARGSDDERVTRDGLVVGTLAYLAPERFEGPGDLRGDVYALACVLFEALTGRPPFVTHDLFGALRAHTSDPPPRASAGARGVPSALDDAIIRGLAKDPRARFPAAGALADAARAALREPSRATPPPTFWPPSPEVEPVRQPTLVAPVAVPRFPDTGQRPDDHRYSGPIPGRSRRRSGRRVLAVVGGLVAVAGVVTAVTLLAGREAAPGAQDVATPVVATPVVATPVVTVPVVAAPVLVDSVAIGAGPEGVAVTPDGSRVVTTDYAGGTVAIIDPGRPQAEPVLVAVGEGPQTLAVSPDGARVYVAVSGTGEVVVVDVATGVIVDSVTVGAEPQGVAVSPGATASTSPPAGRTRWPSSTPHGWGAPRSRWRSATIPPRSRCHPTVAPRTSRTPPTTRCR